jgi:PBP1b-binding outer membrane lipoprotein LpoB
MKKNLFLLIVISSIFFLNGCVKQPNTNSKIIPKEQVQQSLQNKIPAWLDDPQKMADGKLTAVGCASRHINGEVAQKKLALQRAIDEIAMQKRTKVQTVSYTTKIITASDKSSKIESSSLQEVEKIEVSTKVMEYYTKPDGDICVWVVEN